MGAWVFEQRSGRKTGKQAEAIKDAQAALALQVMQKKWAVRTAQAACSAEGSPLGKPAAARGRRGMLLTAGLLLAAGLTAGGLRLSGPDGGPASAAAVAAEAPQAAAARAAEDTAALLAGAGAQYAAPPAVTLRFCSVDLGPAAAARAAALEAARELGLRAAAVESAADDAAAYRADGAAALGAEAGGAPRGRATLLLAGSGDGLSSFLIVKLDAPRLTEPDALLAWQRAAGERLAELGVGGAWNAQLQGELAPGAKPETALSAIARSFAAKPLETYEDGGTRSVSYGSERLHRTVRSGSRDIALQAALHRDTTDGQWRLTVGTPVITTEY